MLKNTLLCGRLDFALELIFLQCHIGIEKRTFLDFIFDS